MADRNNALSLPCKELEENLVLFHYGDLADTERDALQVHLGSCAGCADYLKELTALLPLTIKTDEPPCRGERKEIVVAASRRPISAAARPRVCRRRGGRLGADAHFGQKHVAHE
ncbi:MAG: zf-HC2 domain-containing protein [Deltaproteobacteria bacterium]|nr:MAG: zf-HC2 domain-containing protein [Deltaproteobacteria bacterium]